MERLTKNNYADDCSALQNKKNRLPEYKDNHYIASQHYVTHVNEMVDIPNGCCCCYFSLTPKQGEQILRDLEVLEILKKHLFIVEPDNEEDLKEFNSVDYLRLMDYMTRKDYQKVKEWLENE